MESFAKSDFTPMFVEDITWYNDSVRELAEAQCGNDIECLFDAAATNDVSVGIVTKDINIQLVNESNTLGKLLKMGKKIILEASTLKSIGRNHNRFSGKSLN